MKMKSLLSLTDGEAVTAYKDRNMFFISMRKRHSGKLVKQTNCHLTQAPPSSKPINGNNFFFLSQAVGVKRE